VTALDYADETNTTLNLGCFLPRPHLNYDFKSIWTQFKATIKTGQTRLEWLDVYDHDRDFCVCTPNDKGCVHHVHLSLSDVFSVPQQADSARMQLVARDMVLFLVECMKERACEGFCEDSRPWLEWLWTFCKKCPNHKIFVAYLAAANYRLLCDTVALMVQKEHGLQWESGLMKTTKDDWYVKISF